MFRFLRSTPRDLPPRMRLEAALWAMSVSGRRWLGLPADRVAGKKLAGAESAAPELFACWQALDFAYDADAPLTPRLERVGEALGLAGRLECISQELLLWAAATRWLHRVRQPRIVAQSAARYRALSLALTSGAGTDALGVLDDILESRYADYPADAQERGPAGIEPGKLTYLRRIKTGWVNRSASLSALSIEIAGAIGRRRFNQIFNSEERAKRLKQDELDAIVSIAARHLGSLKGPVMKLGQTASYFGIELPKVASELLTRLPDRSEPLDPERALRIVETELGKKASQLFEDFVSEPLGVGSIGQVHRATLKNGRHVAVKVQYPGMTEVIESDLTVLRLLLPVIRLFTAQAFPRAVFEELRARLLEECDYELEAAHQAGYRERFRGHWGLYVPEVFPKLSTKRVLTMELVEGMRFAEFARHASEAERTHAARAIMEYVVSGCRDGWFNSDPHPGNFLFHGRRVVCLDFGAVKQWSAAEARPWADAILAAVTSDYELFRKAVLDLGLVGSPRNFDFKHFYGVYLSGSMGKVAEAKPTCFDHETLHQEFLSAFGPGNPNLPHLHYNPKYLYGFRVYFGLISLLAELEADCNYHEELCRILRTASHGAPPSKSLQALTNQKK